VRALLVDDDPEFSEELAGGLGALGLEVTKAGEGQHAINRCGDVDIVLLDLMLPDIDGFQVCQEIRLTSDVPVIILSGRSDEFDQVLSFKVGADDYVIKPCRLRELAARMEAAVRRARGVWPARHAQQVRRFCGLSMDYALRQATVDGRHLPLTLKEFDLLRLLTSEPGRVFAREEIMSEVWGYEGASDSRTLGVHMVSLRRKLGASIRIETVRGVGFRLVV